MVRTGPIKVGRFSKSVAASTFDFLQKNAENIVITPPLKSDLTVFGPSTSPDTSDDLSKRSQPIPWTNKDVR